MTANSSTCDEETLACSATACRDEASREPDHRSKAAADSTEEIPVKDTGQTVHLVILAYAAEAIGYLSVALDDFVSVRFSSPVPGDPGCKFTGYIFARRCADGASGWLPKDVLSSDVWKRYADADGRPWLYNEETEEFRWEVADNAEAKTRIKRRW